MDRKLNTWPLFRSAKRNPPGSPKVPKSRKKNSPRWNELELGFVRLLNFAVLISPKTVPKILLCRLFKPLLRLLRVRSPILLGEIGLRKHVLELLRLLDSSKSNPHWLIILLATVGSLVFLPRKLGNHESLKLVLFGLTEMTMNPLNHIIKGFCSSKGPVLNLFCIDLAEVIVWVSPEKLMTKTPKKSRTSPFLVSLGLGIPMMFRPF